MYRKQLGRICGTSRGGGYLRSRFPSTVAHSRWLPLFRTHQQHAGDYPVLRTLWTKSLTDMNWISSRYKNTYQRGAVSSVHLTAKSLDGWKQTIPWQIPQLLARLLSDVYPVVTQTWFAGFLNHHPRILASTPASTSISRLITTTKRPDIPSDSRNPSLSCLPLFKIFDLNMTLRSDHRPPMKTDNVLSLLRTHHRETCDNPSPRW